MNNERRRTPCIFAMLGCMAITATIAPAAMSQSNSHDADWRTLDPDNTLYMELPSGRVVIELAPQFAPKHVENIRALVRARYFDEQRIIRAQDNFVVQWGDASIARPLGEAKATLPGEFTRSAIGLPFTPLPDKDTYAPQTGFSDGFPAARESARGQAWAVHCYGAIGVGRDTSADSGGGAELYAVIGHAPRQLDRNVTIVGRVVHGMELLSALPRGTGEAGFYERPEEYTVIKSVRLASELPESKRWILQALRTDSKEFLEHVESRRNRRDEWYKVRANAIDVCNVPLPVRRVGT
jgi:peptidylprolyl isomerase